MALAARQEWYGFVAASADVPQTLIDVLLKNSSTNEEVVTHQPDVVRVIKRASSSFDLVLRRPLRTFEQLDEIRASELLPAGKRVAYGIRSLIQASASGLVEEITRTDDGGLTMEYTSARTGREITFLLPPDGRVRYFVASGGGERYAGIVLADDALGELALWAAQKRALPARGLQVGDSSLRRRR
jgi:hypothetical protein